MRSVAGVLRAFADAPQPDTGFSALMAAFFEDPGYRLATILQHDPEAALCRRVWTNDPARYPIGGAKPVADAPWAQAALFEARIFHAPDEDAVRAAYADHAIIASLGCASAVNFPVRWNGTVIGTINLLHDARHFVSVDLSGFETLVQLATAPLIARGPLAAYG
ncbi:GAF domain-containing protein [Nguyenibacter sp. L1]|uniref:GAF domain-containing protein n=1 Tax=Nguyenibacter sp. L1 TaxID=3049350 RepID=UPI002B47766F|nr:GAF domain-containing protein [Nguyenibacter sp. L1]WRH87184.1 GAF domain-containing protein [Nguyenibacter sp. L1]